MVSRNGNRLEIFDSFEVDRNLPKYTKGQEVVLTESLQFQNGTTWVTVGGGSTATTVSGIGQIIVSNNEFWGNSGSNDGVGFQKTEKPSFWDRFKKKDKKVVKERQKTMTILNFFSSLAQSLNDLKTLQDIGIHYETLITNAEKAGQKALVDKLKLRLESAKSEIQLVVFGLQKYLTEEQVVDFYNQTDKDKNLKLTWIKHFIKPIPSKALEEKAKLDGQFVFDNYVILHYDPNNDATDLTTEEKEERVKREKDPILFGVIKDSRRLYYIADWQDDYCTLTLDTVIETLQEKVGELNNETVKTYLDLGERKDVREKLQLPSPPQEEPVLSSIERAKKRFTKSVKDFMPKRKSLRSVKELTRSDKKKK